MVYIAFLGSTSLSVFFLLLEWIDGLHLTRHGAIGKRGIRLLGFDWIIVASLDRLDLMDSQRSRKRLRRHTERVYELMIHQVSFRYDKIDSPAFEFSSHDRGCFLSFSLSLLFLCPSFLLSLDERLGCSRFSLRMSCTSTLLLIVDWCFLWKTALDIDGLWRLGWNKDWIHPNFIQASSPPQTPKCGSYEKLSRRMTK